MSEYTEYLPSEQAARLYRIEHIFQFMEWDELTTSQLEMIESFKRQFKACGRLSDRQYEVLKDIFKQAIERKVNRWDGHY